MNELFDRLIIRIFFTIFIVAILYLYRYAHVALYPSSRKQMLKKFFPATNDADSVHLFGRIIGIGLIFSTLDLHIEKGLFLALFNFFFLGVLNFILYLISIYILESIILYNFEYADEVLKRKNISYSTITFAIAISLAYVMRIVNYQAQGNAIIMMMLWLFAMVIFGFSTKIYKYVSELHFYQLLINKNFSLAISYTGFLFACTSVITTSFDQSTTSIKNYAILIILKTLLAAIICPIFYKGIHFVFKIQTNQKNKDREEIELPELGYGVYEGAIFFTTGLLTSIITGRIYFGTNYPIF